MYIANLPFFSFFFQFKIFSVANANHILHGLGHIFICLVHHTLCCIGKLSDPNYVVTDLMQIYTRDIYSLISCILHLKCDKNLIPQYPSPLMGSSLQTQSFQVIHIMYCQFLTMLLFHTKSSSSFPPQHSLLCTTQSLDLYGLKLNPKL